jgi:hypothetical protein
MALNVRNFLFILTFLSSCKSSSDQARLSILWENGKPVGIIIPFNPVKSFSPGFDDAELRAIIKRPMDSLQLGILGNWDVKEDTIVFRPLIPLTRGLKYEILYKERKVGEVDIPLPDSSQIPVITGIYPSSDSVPENLLKLYIEFSKPMSEGNSLVHFMMIKNGSDTLRDVFLDLQTELWNKEQDRLTIWLDPGRIKRDLQPNKSLGNPLNKGDKYRFIVGASLSDAEGISLGKNYQKDFVVIGRDSIMPNSETWILYSPKKGTTEALKVDLTESLDYVLLKNAIRIIDENGKVINGKINTDNDERVLYVTPESPWKQGNYVMEIEARLEDLAGNNLNYPFDRDITLKETKKPQAIFRKSFNIK